MAHLPISRVFTTEGVHPFDTTEWELRDASITNTKGDVLFEQKGVEFPKSWSPLAVNVVASKYFYGDVKAGNGSPKDGKREYSLKQLAHRVACTITDWGLEQGLYGPDAAGVFYDELIWLIIHQHGAFNSPVWFNLGLGQQYGLREQDEDSFLFRYDAAARKSVRVDPYMHGMGAACYILPVDDTMEDITRLWTESSRLFKHGSGVGSDWSRLRSSKDKLSTGGQPSGPVSFMRVQDQVGGTIKSGGRNRRAAIMQTLRCDHPDIEEFIAAKAEEEKKAWALIEEGYDGSFNGPAYGSVAFQNVNQSVRATDEFMQMVDKLRSMGDLGGRGTFPLRSPATGAVVSQVDPEKILQAIAEGTWICGDPGVQFHDRFNQYNKVPHVGEHRSTNPCCLTGETLVDTSEGLLRIDELEAMRQRGEALPLAFAFDTTTRLPVLRQIKDAWVAGQAHTLVEVRTDKGVVVRCTPDHRFLTYDGTYVEAQHLEPGQRLRKIARSESPDEQNDQVSSVEHIAPGAPVTVYDIEVDGTNNFGITHDGAPGLHTIVVHNSEHSNPDGTPCNLASLNLRKFQKEDGSFDVERFKAAIRIFLTAQEITVGNIGYPSALSAEMAYRLRPLGLGMTNLGALLMSMGLPYDSDEGRAVASAINAVHLGESYSQSARLAAAAGPFEDYDPVMLRVLGQYVEHGEAFWNGQVHADNHTGTPIAAAWREVCPDLGNAARRTLQEMMNLGERYGYRNNEVSCWAPTGTIALMMDCDTTGIEPDIALVKYKMLAGKGDGMMKIVNQTVPEALRRLGYDEEIYEQGLERPVNPRDAILDYIQEHDTIEGAPFLKEEHLAVFDCAFKPAKGHRSISYEGHMRMMAATQPFTSMALSKTVNMPESATVDEIMDAYMLGWKLGLKAVAIYRDNSKRSQPLSTTKGGNTKNKQTEAAGDGQATGLDAAPQVVERIVEIRRPTRRRLPDERPTITKKINVAGHEGYLHVGLYPDTHLPGEIFINMAKQGSTIGGLMDAFATAVSIGLQYGVPLETLVEKFSFVQFEPAGFTGDRHIPSAKSIIDYIFRYLGQLFVTKEREHVLVDYVAASAETDDETPYMTLSAKESAPQAAVLAAPAPVSSDTPPCPNCGSLTVRAGSCASCTRCGTTTGCG